MNRLFTIAVLCIATLCVATSSAVARTKITGRVVDDQKEPLAGVTVSLVPGDKAMRTMETKTKKKGQYIFALVREGEYELTFAAEGMRVAEVDIVSKDKEGRTKFEFAGPLQPGAPMPTLKVTETDEVVYDAVLKPAAGGGGKTGTGVPLLGTGELVELVRAQDYDKARAEIERGLEATPDDTRLYYLKAFIEMEAGRPEESSAAIDRVIELDPAFPGARLLKGKLLEDAGEVDPALVEYRAEAAATSDPQVHRDALVRVAVLCESEGRQECAVEALNELVESNPGDSTAFAQLIDVYTRVGDTAKVDELMAAAPEDVRNDPVIHYNIAAAYWEEGRSDAAAAEFAKVIELDPGMADAYRNLAYARIGTGDLKGAIEAFERYLEVAPEAADAAEIRSVVESLRATTGAEK